MTALRFFERKERKGREGRKGKANIFLLGVLCAPLRSLRPKNRVHQLDL
jgi:hypothetical protein